MVAEAGWPRPSWAPEAEPGPWLEYGTGGGVVWDSEPEREVAETRTKALVLERALGETPRKLEAAGPKGGSSAGRGGGSPRGHEARAAERSYGCKSRASGAPSRLSMTTLVSRGGAAAGGTGPAATAAAAR